ncbi:MAG: response regulator [Candidatus Latescibacteria bacterium]|nr:response regulator [Candidatus Latescibacterota bacterium]
MSTLLIVDDNQQNLYMLQVLLSAKGYQVEMASNGAEALEQACCKPPNMVISDILMPVMDGFELCRAWHKNERLKNIPFVFYTATYTDIKDENFALSLGADRFIIKPVEPDKFLSMIIETMDNHKAGKSIIEHQPTEETEFYKKYSTTLIRKLEDKMLQLEEANRTLERDIAEHKRTKEILRESESKYRTLIENIPQKIFIKNRDSVYVSCNRNFANEFHIDPDDIAGKSDFDLFPREMAEKYRTDDRRIMESGQTEEIEEKYIKDGNELWIWTVKTPIRDEKNTITGVLGIFWDITERRRAEDEQRKLKDQMIQTQKMESVGRLAGGIAHDFNNMLGVIFGYVELALLQIDSNHPLYSEIREIQKAAKRSAELTRQLLAFARRQPISRKVLDLNETMTGMLKMLHRLLGEDIEIILNRGDDIWLIKMDPSQLDQILVNLCVNARDAIAGVGQVVIETNNMVFDKISCRQLKGLLPGEYIKLSVRDSGCGMDEETLKHIFEPFFTTKSSSKGTGLGLATVYGIVEQNDGHINVISEPQKGTTFELYFPRHIAPAEQGRTPDHTVSAIPGQKITVLLLEDEPQLMKLVRMMLESLGCQVLSAVTPHEAIQLAKEHVGEIHLLMTDLVMPEMNGKDLSKCIRELHSHVKSLFISGYTADVIGTQDLLEEGVHFLQKPFTMNDLASKVREVMDQKQSGV